MNTHSCITHFTPILVPSPPRLKRIARRAWELSQALKKGWVAERKGLRIHEVNKRIYKERLWRLDLALNPRRIPLNRPAPKRPDHFGWPAEIGVGLESLDKAFLGLLGRWGLRWITAVVDQTVLQDDGYDFTWASEPESLWADLYPSLRGRDEWRWEYCLEADLDGGFPERKVWASDDDPYTFTDLDIETIDDSVNLIREGLTFARDLIAARREVLAIRRTVTMAEPVAEPPAPPSLAETPIKKSKGGRKKGQNKSRQCRNEYITRALANQPLPSPEELAAMFGCSLSTAYRAVQDLEERYRFKQKQDAEERYRDHA